MTTETSPKGGGKSKPRSEAQSESKLGRELQTEIARVARPAWAVHGGDRVGRHITRSPGFAESVSTYWERGAYALFEEMEAKDAHLHSILMTRRNGVLARPRVMEAAGTEESELEIARWTDRALAAVPDLDAALGHLLGAMAYGMAVLEVVWGYDAQGRIVPVRLKPRAPWRFCFDAEGALALNDDPLAELAGDARAQNSGAHPPRWDHPIASRTRALPPRKFIVMCFGADDERPYGRGLCERVYWLWWFKKNNVKFWAMFNEKFGAPTVVAKHRAGLNQAERDRLLEMLGTIQSDAGITLPEGIELDLLESARRGSSETYRDMAAFCNEEMSRAVLGQTLTVSEGQRSSSLAMARVHEAVRFDYIRADASLLMSVVNNQLVRWMTDFNFGERAVAPRWSVDLVPDLDVEIEAQVDRQLLQMGVPLPLRHFYEKYRRPAPAAGERQVRYDDHNLYQYHLAYGVMTVNEVRASLGLAPVAWGDVPPAPVTQPRVRHGASGIPSPPGGAGEDLAEEDLDLRGEAEEERRAARPGS